jgi:DNA-binding transcriptional LysR family regulator
MRQGRALLLTGKGRELVPEIRNLLLKAEDLKNLAIGINAIPKNLRIGTFEVFSTYVLGSMVEEHFSQLSIEVHEQIPGEIEIALIEGRIDIGITYIPIPKPSLHFDQIGKVNMGIYTGVKSEEKFSKLNAQDLPFVVPITPVVGSPNRVRGLDGWPDDQVPRFTPYKVTLLESALELCRRGLAVAYIPDFVAKLHNLSSAKNYQLRAIQYNSRKPSPQRIFMVRDLASGETKEYRLISKFIRNLCRS